MSQAIRYLLLVSVHLTATFLEPWEFHPGDIMISFVLAAILVTLLLFTATIPARHRLLTLLIRSLGILAIPPALRCDYGSFCCVAFDADPALRAMESEAKARSPR